MLLTLSSFEKSRREVAPHNFLFWWNPRRATVKKIGREVAPHDFLSRSNYAPRHIEKNWQGGRATSFPFWIEIRESAVLEWGRATIGLQKECHVRFCPIYGIPREQNASKTRAKREKHASLSGFRLHSSGTPLPFSDGTRVLPVPLSQKSEDLEGYVFKMRMSI